MKKLFLTLLFAGLLGLSALCSAASVGSTLDAELATVDKFLQATQYKQVAAILHDEYKAEFKEENFNKFRELVGANLGSLQSKTLRVIIKGDDVDVLHYDAHFEKDPTAEYVFYFMTVKNKPLLRNFEVLQTPKEAAAGAEGQQGK